jgi:hypothetical protein
MKAKKSVGVGLLMVGLSVGLLGCASTPLPRAELAVSKAALESAVSAGGAEYAPVELKTAQDKVASAEKAVAKEEYKEARYLAEQAVVDAKLAENKALAAKAQKSVVDSQQGQRALQEEMQRQQTK